MAFDNGSLHDYFLQGTDEVHFRNHNFGCFYSLVGYFGSGCFHFDPILFHEMTENRVKE